MVLAWKRVDSVVFETNKLNDVRRFYEHVLEMPIARYIKQGLEVEDVSERHVNYRIGKALVGFEIGDRTDTGSLVLRVEDLSEARSALTARTNLVKNRDFFIVVRDPDGREIIIEEET